MEVFGHRGACGYLPENTMESFEHAFELGAAAIEFDVVMTQDGVPVIRHDRDLTHTTDIQKHSFLSNMVDELKAEDVHNSGRLSDIPMAARSLQVTMASTTSPPFERL